MRIGVDVGGTNTDAALLQGNDVLDTVKSPTTADISSGVLNAVESVMKAGSVAPADIGSVMIGTTQFTNAFVERKNLCQIGVLRLALPATESLPPLTDWPETLVDAVGRNVYMVNGGYEFDGSEISPLDEQQVRAAADDMASKGIDSVAISSVFSPVNPDMERRAAEIVRSAMPGVRVTLASDIGRLSLIERENAAVMNASLADLAAKVVGSFRASLKDLRIDAPFFISQNDGTLMSADFVELYPVLTFASGPTNSMRGAALLSGIEDGIVVDIGGTTSDVGALTGGFPRESSVPVDIGNVRTNFRMPDVLALGLGGGSIVRRADDGTVTVGPDSVGFRLLRDAVVFGGDTLTATDIAVAAGQAKIGDPSRLNGRVDDDLIQTAIGTWHAMLEEAIDRMKTSHADVPVVLVGGGSILVSRLLKGVSDLFVPDRSSEANAIGAAFSQVGGEVDRVFKYDEIGREDALVAATGEAGDKAVRAGADPDTLRTIDLEELPIAYGPGHTVRVRVKVVGNLA